MSPTTISTKRLTAADFYEFIRRPENENKFFELERGEVIELASPTIPHGFLCCNFGRILGNYTMDHGFGYATSNDTGVILARDPDTVRGPDVAFYQDADHFQDLHPKYGEVLPRLAVEVLSPDDRASKVMRKINEYLRSGIALVWIVDPDTLTITVYRADRAATVLTQDDEITGDEILPGFRHKVGDFFRTGGDKKKPQATAN